MDNVERSVLWHRLISVVNLDEYYGVDMSVSYEEQVRHVEKYGEPYDFHLQEIYEMHRRLIAFSEDNPETINDADDDIKAILMQTMPKFLRKYPQYKDEACIKKQ